LLIADDRPQVVVVLLLGAETAAHDDRKYLNELPTLLGDVFDLGVG
jgi:hypothetical protein